MTAISAVNRSRMWARASDISRSARSNKLKHQPHLSDPKRSLGWRSPHIERLSSVLIAAVEAVPDQDRAPCRRRRVALLSRHNRPSGRRDRPDARRPNCRKDRAKVADATFLAPKISRPSSMTIASASSKPLVSLRCLIVSMISWGIPSRDHFRLVRRPLELAVELTSGGENGQLANSSSLIPLVTQIAVERPSSTATARDCAALYRRDLSGL